MRTEKISTASGIASSTWIVLDASVVAKWYLADEPDRPQALRVLELIATEEVEPASGPRLALEVGQALVRAIRRGRFAADAIRAALSALDDIDIRGDDRTDTPVEAAEVALQAGLSVYDASYLVVASRLRAPLVTADRRLYDAGLAAGYNVAWLGDLPLP